jgi:exo-beta-1,3-glucanase (GH17 family)
MWHDILLQKDEASSRTVVAAARVNSMQKRLAISVNAAVYQIENEIEFKKAVEFLLQSVKDANGIFNGTVTGIVVTSGYTLSDKATNLRRMLQYVSERTSIPLGVRANNCDEIESWVQTKHETTLEILKFLGFIICHKLPTPGATPELSADNIINYFKRIVEIKKNPHLKLIAQTGWPSEGRTPENIVGSVEAMNRFWCRMIRLVNESVGLDLFTAFDEPWKNGHMHFPATAEPHYGWWVRVGNDSSGPNDFEEKINYRNVA